MFWGTEERDSGLNVSLWDLSRVHVVGALGDPSKSCAGVSGERLAVLAEVTCPTSPNIDLKVQNVTVIWLVLRFLVQPSGPTIPSSAPSLSIGLCMP